MLIDAHAHLDRYGAELEDALAEIRREGILTLSNSMDIASYERNVAIAKSCDLVLPTFGVHPWNAPEYAKDLQELEPLIEQSPMIGEVGLDYFFVKERSHYPDQRKVFEFFLAAAETGNQIVSLHTKGAEKDVLDLLRRYDVERAIVHWYSGPRDTFQQLADRGAYFTVSAEVLWSEHIQDLVRVIPRDRLLTETDNPGGPRSVLGRPGMPLLIDDIVTKIAGLIGVTRDELVSQVQQNFLRLIETDQRLADVARRLSTAGTRGHND